MSVPSDLSELSEEQLAALLRAVITELAGRGTPDSFSALVEASAQVGTGLGESARQVAARSSWTQVGELSGTTKQAAWSRWR